MSQRLKRWSLPVEGRTTKEEADLQDRNNSKNKRRCCGKVKEGGEGRAVAMKTKTVQRQEESILPLIFYVCLTVSGLPSQCNAGKDSDIVQFNWSVLLTGRSFLPQLRNSDLA